MFLMVEHDAATCPDCGAPLRYWAKEEASCWKVYYECGFERKAGIVQLSDIDHHDEVDEHAAAMGKCCAEGSA